ncbi:DUF4111 domain-containing protein [Lapidilactobacillus bayanensis]|uniref:DUF4111 domain-containing protein n=1 Tax=Lapidilactobacillus bayanensis TaxID=2485998 RepID=UPI000F76A41B|nr:DUF4111 domain-containing protein [Lapidilactobacillus bayanensis]
MNRANISQSDYQSGFWYIQILTATNGTDEDLTAHLMITKKYGVVLTGRPIDDVFCAVPQQAYFRSILFDIGDADQEIISKPMYMILNLCRALAFKTDGLVTSKLSGGEWACHFLPTRWESLVQQALAEYSCPSKTSTQYRHQELVDFAKEMLKRIKE